LVKLISVIIRTVIQIAQKVFSIQISDITSIDILFCTVIDFGINWDSTICYVVVTDVTT